MQNPLPGFTGRGFFYFIGVNSSNPSNLLNSSNHVLKEYPKNTRDRVCTLFRKPVY